MNKICLIRQVPTYIGHKEDNVKLSSKILDDLFLYNIINDPDT